mmetsp:Transcript_951/g.4022  ORF Transcript_951/g.4022 Transcript_951/m.4022 type:complete len:225 (-) Transcript_951:801-1475(-)
MELRPRLALCKFESPFIKPGARCKRVIAIAFRSRLTSRLTREYPSAAPVATFSWRTRTLRISAHSASAPTTCISEVPGLAKHTSTPPAAATLQSAVAPVISFGSSDMLLHASRCRAHGPSRLDFPNNDATAREMNEPPPSGGCRATFASAFDDASPPSVFVLKIPLNAADVARSRSRIAASISRNALTTFASTRPAASVIFLAFKKSSLAASSCPKPARALPRL